MPDRALGIGRVTERRMPMKEGARRRAARWVSAIQAPGRPTGAISADSDWQKKKTSRLSPKRYLERYCPGISFGLLGFIADQFDKPGELIFIEREIALFGRVKCLFGRDVCQTDLKLHGEFHGITGLPDQCDHGFRID